jgi:hypothetical protein
MPSMTDEDDGVRTSFANRIDQRFGYRAQHKTASINYRADGSIGRRDPIADYFADTKTRE